MRIGEAIALKWVDIDFTSKTIRINSPEKHSDPRIVRISDKLLGMLNALPRKSERVFGSSMDVVKRQAFCEQRKKIAHKLQNPRILQIHFHTLRHWKATMLYHQTKDILYVMHFLGHKNIKNTLLYIQLAEVIFKEASDSLRRG